MSSRKEVQNHNMFEETKFQKKPKHKENVQESYADNEKMTIPQFDNRVVRDSGWSHKVDTK